MITTDGVSLAVRVSGGRDRVPVLQLSGGPGCANYLPDAAADAPARVFSPDPRGVGGSQGGPHDLDRALADLEELRHHVHVDRWVLLGHSFGADLALAYAVEYPQAVRAVLAACGAGVQNDRDWQSVYEALKDTEPAIDLVFDAAVHRSLLTSWRRWIKEPDLLFRLSELATPVQFVVAENDIRPSWPTGQLAALIPAGSLTIIPGVPHDLWHTHPAVWTSLVESACRL